MISSRRARWAQARALHTVQMARERQRRWSSASDGRSERKMKQSEFALVTKFRVLRECWAIMATAAQVTGHCVCRWARSSMPLPQSTQARLDERHSASPPQEKLRVRPRVGRALCVSRHAWYRSWGGALVASRGCGGCGWRSPRRSRGRPCSGSAVSPARSRQFCHVDRAAPALP